TKKVRAAAVVTMRKLPGCVNCWIGKKKCPILVKCWMNSEAKSSMIASTHLHHAAMLSTYQWGQLH
ncbi:HD domain protein, partial [Vibrio parahaemolyticus V-223/04]